MKVALDATHINQNVLVGDRRHAPRTAPGRDRPAPSPTPTDGILRRRRAHVQPRRYGMTSTATSADVVPQGAPASAINSNTGWRPASAMKSSTGEPGVASNCARVLVATAR